MSVVYNHLESSMIRIIFNRYITREGVRSVVGAYIIIY